MQHYKLLTGDVLEQLKTLPADYFDAVLSDPPYGISFMSKEWDKGVPSSEVYAELMRVLKPGAFGLHFGGTRMWHRLAVNIEDAGFELRDTVMWLYGVGFPKSHNISKALDKAAGAEREVLGRNPNSRENCDKSNTIYESGTVGKTDYITAPATAAARQWHGYGTALKPAFEPALLVQKPLDKTFANNVLAHGCGALNIDGCRVGDEPVAKLISAPTAAKGGRLLGGSVLNTIKGCELGVAYGRFPANLILDEEVAAALDATVPASKSPATTKPKRSTRPQTSNAYGEYSANGRVINGHGDAGGPSRFFYCAKVSTKERNAGCGELEDKEWSGDGACVPERANRPFIPSKNNHPTLKPLVLTEYMAKLLLVPKRADGQPRRILVPFSGAGSEMIGALKAGWDEVWGIELNGDYVKIAKARIKHHCPDAQ